MFERFNENVHRALFFARYEASREASHQVATVLIENRSADEIRLRVRMGDGRPEAAVVDSQGVV